MIENERLLINGWSSLCWLISASLNGNEKKTMAKGTEADEIGKRRRGNVAALDDRMSGGR